MGANGDAGSLTIDSPSISFGALHAGDPIQAPRGDNPALIRDYPSRVGNLDLRGHLTQVDPGEMCTVLTKVYAEDLPSGPQSRPMRWVNRHKPFACTRAKAPASVVARFLDQLNTCRPLVGR